MPESVIRRNTIALVAVAIVSVLVAAGVREVAGSSSRHSSARVEKEVSALLTGIPQNGDTLGQASAPITLQIFGDLESEDDRTFILWLLPNIIRDWVRTNAIKIQYHSLMTESLADPKVFVSQQVAALAAGLQDKLWNFIETFYHEQDKEETPHLTEGYLDSVAGQVPGLDLSQWESDRENSQLAKQVVKDDHVARVTGLYDTPSFLVGRTGEKLAPWLGYRLYEEPGPKDTIRQPVHPLSYITSKILKKAIN